MSNEASARDKAAVSGGPGADVAAAASDFLNTKISPVAACAIVAHSVVVGNALNLYAAMDADDSAASGESEGRCTFTAAQLAAAAAAAGGGGGGDLSARYVREWLCCQASAEIVRVVRSSVRNDDDDGVERIDEVQFYLPEAHALVLARPDSHCYGVGILEEAHGAFDKMDALLQAFRTGAGIPWSDMSPWMFSGVEKEFAVTYRNELVANWIPSLSVHVQRKLRTGRRHPDATDARHDEAAARVTVLDVGCGHGVSTQLLARAFPRAHFIGVDFHDASIERARRNCAGLPNVEFHVTDAKSYDGIYDMICGFDTFHDQGDIVGALRHARAHLMRDNAEAGPAGGDGDDDDEPRSVVMMIEPRAHDSILDDVGDVYSAVCYAAGTAGCVPCSLAQEVRSALGPQAGKKRLERAARQAGMQHFRTACGSEYNTVYEAW